MASGEFSSDRPVPSVVQKRILHYEAKAIDSRKSRKGKSRSKGKALQKQEESLLSKPIVEALMKELKELRSKLISALAEEHNQTMATSVLRTLVKRIKKNQKKCDYIARLEESRASGETLKKEKEEVLRSKPIVTALMKELSDLTWPLISALAEELRQICKSSVFQFDAFTNTYNPIEELLRLVNWASLLDARSQSEFPSVTLMRRYDKRCLMYDYITDKEVQLLTENDQNFISLLRSLVTSQPVNETGSHKSAFVATAPCSYLISESTSRRKDGGSKSEGKMEVHANSLSPKMESPFGPSCCAMNSFWSETLTGLMDGAILYWDFLCRIGMDIIFIFLRGSSHTD